MLYVSVYRALRYEEQASDGVLAAPSKEEKGHLPGWLRPGCLRPSNTADVIRGGADHSHSWRRLAAFRQRLVTAITELVTV
jgi:hypothetical protein